MSSHRLSGALPAAARLFVLAAACGLFIGLIPRALHAQTPAAGASAARPEAGSTYEIRKGDTLYRIAGKVRHPGVSLPQMVLALYGKNPDAFLEGNINQLIVGQVLKVPPREAVLAVDAAHAASAVRELVARPLVPVPAMAPPTKPAPVPVPKPRAEPPPKPTAPAAAPSLTPAQAEESYRKGLALERKGDPGAALKAFLAAGQSGHGPAQKKLGDIYNTGNAVVERDYQTALKWYEKARAQGIEIPKPLTPGFRQ